MKRTRQQVRDQLRDFIQKVQVTEPPLPLNPPFWRPREDDLDRLIDLVRYPPLAPRP